MLERNSTAGDVVSGALRRKLTGCFDRFCRFTGGGIAAGKIALTALGVLYLVDETTATATCITALSLGWLLLVGALMVKRGSNQLSECFAKVRWVHPHSVRRGGSLTSLFNRRQS